MSGRALMLAFVPVMLVAAGAIWQRAGANRDERERARLDLPLTVLLAGSSAIGALVGT